MIKVEKMIKVERTKKGFPALWETGGGMTNTGSARVVVNADGTRKKPVYVRNRGHLACLEHALFVVRPGDVVIDAWHHRGDFEITVFRVLEVKEDLCAVDPIHHFSDGEWDVTPPAFLDAAIDAACEKATCYHCREPHFAAVE